MRNYENTNGQILKALDPIFRDELEWYVRSITKSEELKYNVTHAHFFNNAEALYGKLPNKTEEKQEKAPLNIELFHDTPNFGKFSGT